MQKIIVALMVKNEEAIIERALSSIIGWADKVVICDTGSTDSTKIRAALFLQARNIPFKIYDDPFINFAHNRTSLLRKCWIEPEDYVFMLDADEYFQNEDGKAINRDLEKLKKSLAADVYNVNLRTGTTTYYLPRLTRNSIDIEYVGVTHEYLNTKGYSVENLTKDVEILQINDSNRRVTKSKFFDDIELLENALRFYTTPELKQRYIFYLAQSYKDMGEIHKAIGLYEQRIALGGWEEEIFYSYYQIGLLYKKLGYVGLSQKNLIAAWLASKKTRVEPLVAMREFYSANDAPTLTANNFLEHIIKTTPKPQNALFLEEDKYAK